MSPINAVSWWDIAHLQESVCFYSVKLLFPSFTLQLGPFSIRESRTIQTWMSELSRTRGPDFLVFPENLFLPHKSAPPGVKVPQYLIKLMVFRGGTYTLTSTPKALRGVQMVLSPGRNDMFPEICASHAGGRPLSQPDGPQGGPQGSTDGSTDGASICRAICRAPGGSNCVRFRAQFRFLN